jgi:hypothetical protein
MINVINFIVSVVFLFLSVRWMISSSILFMHLLSEVLQHGNSQRARVAFLMLCVEASKMVLLVVAALLHFYFFVGGVQ